MNKVAFFVNNLALNQTNYQIVKSLNERNYKDDIAVFYENKAYPFTRINFATMNVVDAWSYTGNIISTNLTTTYKTITFPNVINKYFYVADLEWIYLKNKRYEMLLDIYNNDDIKLLARSERHAKAIESAWGNKVRGVVDNFNLKKILDIVNEDSNVNRKR